MGGLDCVAGLDCGAGLEEPCGNRLGVLGSGDQALGDWAGL